MHTFPVVILNNAIVVIFHEQSIIALLYFVNDKFQQRACYVCFNSVIVTKSQQTNPTNQLRLFPFAYCTYYARFHCIFIL